MHRPVDLASGVSPMTWIEGGPPCSTAITRFTRPILFYLILMNVACSGFFSFYWLKDNNWALGPDELSIQWLSDADYLAMRTSTESEYRLASGSTLVLPGDPGERRRMLSFYQVGTPDGRWHGRASTKQWASALPDMAERGRAGRHDLPGGVGPHPSEAKEAGPDRKGTRSIRRDLTLVRHQGPRRGRGKTCKNRGKIALIFVLSTKTRRRPGWCFDLRTFRLARIW